MLRDTTEFESAPWRAVDLSPREHVTPVPTMLAPQEQQLYYWLTSHWTLDIGAVVDLGCFVGGSTARLAAGHLDAGKQNWIHAYDFFKADERTKESILYPQGVPSFKGTDTYWLARDLLEPWHERVSLHRGDILSKSWDGDPIELLVVDAAKSDAVTDHIAKTFFRHLIPGKSLVVQQDYYHWRLPWIAAQMHRMRRYFAPVAYCPNDTVVFLNTQQVTDDALDAGRVSGLSDDAIAANLRRVNWRGIAWHKAYRIRKMIRVLAANPGVRVGHEMRDLDES